MSASDLVKHVVIIVKENHTFDNYFGRFPGVNGAQFPQAGDPTPESSPYEPLPAPEVLP